MLFELTKVRAEVKNIKLTMCVYGIVNVLLIVLMTPKQGYTDEQNLLLNGGMESLDHWLCVDISCEVSDDHTEGQYGLKVTNRADYQDGPTQALTDLAPSKYYLVQGSIKLLNSRGERSREVVEIVVHVLSKEGRVTSILAAFDQHAQVSDEWIRIFGHVNIPSMEIENASIRVEGPTPGVDFVVDNMVMAPAVGLNEWRKESDMVINKYRKSDMHIRVTVGKKVSEDKIEIKVIQQKKSFPFGSAVKCKAYFRSDPRYRQFIHNHFNWAVLENAMKWGQMEPKQGYLHYQLPIRTMKQLKKHGIKVRGHNILWSVNSTVPSWVRELRGQPLRDAVTERIQSVVNKTKGFVEHYDVDNEMLHGSWYQDVLRDPNFNFDVFRMVHHAAPNVKLFLNDFNVVSSRIHTNAYLEQAMKFKEANVGLYGLGIQCHFRSNTAPDPILIKEDLDILQHAGLPIWVTELDVVTPNEHQRAEWYEIALRALYGHPAVEGILVWGFWSRFHWRGESASLVSGPSFKINEAGWRVLYLTEHLWMSRESHVLSRSGRMFTVHGYHGDYDIKVKVNGSLRESLNRRVTLSNVPLVINLHIEE